MGGESGCSLNNKPTDTNKAKGEVKTSFGPCGAQHLTNVSCHPTEIITCQIEAMINMEATFGSLHSLQVHQPMSAKFDN